MRDPDTDEASTASVEKTVQEFIDETPIWSDGTASPSTPLTSMQWTIWWLAAAGKFFEGMVVFMTGVALPLIVKEFELGELAHGAVGAAPLMGILVGATALGGLADRYGRKVMFIAEMIIFGIFLVLLVLSPNYAWLLIFLFGLGIALGCDYPTAHLIISESIPSKSRGRLVLSAFAFQAVGALVGTAVGFLILFANPDIEAWRWMYATVVIPAILVTIGRFYITESPQWLFAQGRTGEAQRETQKLLRRDPPYPKKVTLAEPREVASNGAAENSGAHYAALFSKTHRRATILASVPWFLQDLGTYGIGIFTPTILAATIGHSAESARNLADVIQNDLLAAKGAAFVDILLIVGIVFAVLLADRVGRIKLQVFGFIGCALGLFVASLSTSYDGTAQVVLVFAGFLIFNFMTNLGPNAQTYLLAGEVFPTRIRGKGAGFAASFAKLGAVTTAFLLPILLDDIGTQFLLYILVGTSLLGAVVTWLFRIETTGVNLEAI